MAQAIGEVIHDTDLEDWILLGSGGFGEVCRAWHKTWGLHVAIKLPRHDSCQEKESLLKEADLMKSLVFEFVLRIYGLYDGTPFGETTRLRGIVMEYMGRGSVETLQKNLAGPPPLPLAFRLAHQVALGINFLHLKRVLHQDLKPSNVLLTDELNAKLADFGLSRITTSVLNSGDETAGDNGGTFAYMPPEALEGSSYEPSRSFDIYSYGILLWSIFTGQEPYKGIKNSLVAFRIPKGDRPNVTLCQKNEEGMEELVKLMTQCWDGDPLERPNSEEIKKHTKDLFSKHQSKVNAVVFGLLSQLESPTGVRASQTKNAQLKGVVDHSRFTTKDLRKSEGVHSGQVACPSQAQHRDIHVKQPDIFSPKIPDTVCTKNLTIKEKATFVDDKRPDLIQRTSQIMAIVEELGKRVHPEAYSRIDAKTVPQEKVRELYKTALLSGGDLAKAAFYDALKKHEPDLMEDLGA